MLWNAYYALEPFGGEIKYLAQVEAGVKKFRKEILPDECLLDQPLEDADLNQVNKQIANELTDLARAMLADQGLNLDQMVAEITKGK